MDEMDVGTLQAYRKAAQERIRDIEAEIEPLRKRMDDARRELEALETLLSLKDPEFAGSLQTQSPAGVSGARRPTAIANAAYELLEELDRPVHYSELYQILNSRGVDIPGKNPAANLIGHISPDPRFRRVSRGTYELEKRIT
jgi:hypothetical protein